MSRAAETLILAALGTAVVVFAVFVAWTVGRAWGGMP